MSMYIFSRPRASRAILSNFFEKQWTQNHPQYLSSLCIVDRAKGVTLLPETGLLHITGALYISVRTTIHKMYINKASICPFQSLELRVGGSQSKRWLASRMQ